MSVAHHEIGHALGFIGLFVDDFMLPSESSPWNSKIVNNVFDPGGLNVAMRPGDSSHVLNNSLIMGTALQRGTRPGVSETEIAMLVEAYEFTAVPEPSAACMLMLVGLYVISVRQKRRS